MAITKTGEGIMKYAARWHDFYRGLSQFNKNRINMAGLVKPPREYANQILLGNKAIANKYGYKINHNNSGGRIGTDIDAFSDANTRKITTNFDPSPNLPVNEKLYRELVTRHELLETIAIEKFLQKYYKNPDRYNARILRNFEQAYPAKKGKHTLATIEKSLPDSTKALYGIKHPAKLVPDGKNKIYDNLLSNHVNMNVLYNERKLLDRLPHPQNPAVHEVYRKRYGTGEYQYLDNAGRLGDPKLNVSPQERFNKKNARELIKNRKNPVFVNSAEATYLEPLF